MPGPELPRAAIADADPLIHLDERGCLEVLDGFVEVIVPSVVAAEASRHRLDWQERAPACVVVRDPAAHLVRRVLETPGSRDLDAGELAAMALWLDHREAVLLLAGKVQESLLDRGSQVLSLLHASASR